MLKRRTLLFLLPLLLVGMVVLAGSWWLDRYTRHSEKVRVPELQGLTFQEAEDILTKRGLKVEVVDSIYDNDRPRSTIVEQDPRAGAEVKPDRKVYLVMNASKPKMINMPALVDLSKRQAISVLEILGLKIKELQYRPDPCVDCVVAQLYKGEPIAAEDRIQHGEAVTLVLGSGTKGEHVPVPDLRGSTFAEVQALLNLASLNLGVVVDCKGCNTKNDSAFARVYRQSPAASMNNRISLGNMIDIWLTADTSGLRPASIMPDTLDAPKDQGHVDGQ